MTQASSTKPVDKKYKMTSFISFAHQLCRIGHTRRRTAFAWTREVIVQSINGAVNLPGRDNLPRQKYSDFTYEWLALKPAECAWFWVFELRSARMMEHTYNKIKANSIFIFSFLPPATGSAKTQTVFPTLWHRPKFDNKHQIANSSWRR